MPLVYDKIKLPDIGFRIDILVENELVIEVKSMEAIAPVHLPSSSRISSSRTRRLGSWSTSCRELTGRDLSASQPFLNFDAKSAKFNAKFRHGTLRETWR